MMRRSGFPPPVAQYKAYRGKGCPLTGDPSAVEGVRGEGAVEDLIQFDAPGFGGDLGGGSRG